MSISSETKAQVRARANFACEYCGISETDAGGELTIDHFQPQSFNGSDDVENLVYACFRCNLYKADYWAETESSSQIFNPRRHYSTDHFSVAPDGIIYALSEIAEFTMSRLKLNRPPLVAHRHKINQQISDREFFERTQETNKLFAKTNEELQRVVEEQRKMLEEQQRLLKTILR